MDSLDFNLHQAILSSLAGSYSKDKQKDKHASHSQDTVNGEEDSFDILTSFGIKQDTVHQAVEWRLSDANAVTAASEYLSKRAEEGHGDEAVEEAVLTVLRRLKDIRVERCLGAQGSHSEWLITDQLAFSLSSAAIALGHTAAVDSLFAAYRSLKHNLESAEASRVIEHILPCIHGIQRAVVATSGVWTSSHLSGLLEATQSLSTEAVSNLNSVLTGSFVHSSAEGRAVLSIIARYDAHGVPLVDNLVTKCDAAIVSAVLVSVACGGKMSPGVGWEQLRTGSIQRASPISGEGHTGSFDKLLSFAKSRKDHSLASLRELDERHAEDGEDFEEDGTDHYDLNIVADSLKAATAICIAGHLDNQHLTTLQTLLSDQSPVFDVGVQTAALQSVSVLVHRFPELAESSTTLLRKFITSPLPILTSHDANETAPVLRLAAETLATCIEVLNQDDQTLSTVYSLLNYLPSSSFNHANGSIRPSSMLTNEDTLRGSVNGHQSGHAHRSPAERALVSSNTLYTVSMLAKRFKREEITKLALSMMLQRLRNSDMGLHSPTHQVQQGSHAGDEAALLGIAELAPEAGKADFADTVRALTEFARSRPVEGSGEEGYPALQAAQLKLASSLDGKVDLAAIYLRELLVLFMDQSAPAKQTSASVNGHGSHHILHRGTHSASGSVSVNGSSLSDRAVVLRQLLDTLAVIQALLALPSFQPNEKPEQISDETVILFRNMWLISTALGTSVHGKDTQIHRNYLKTIAEKTPCLLRATPLNYTETELEYNPLLRREHGASADSLRSELSSYLPGQNPLQARTLSHPQTVFLLAVARLESFRAEMGNPSVMLEYFHNEGVNNGALAGPLAEISQKVTEIFTRSFGERVRRHAVKRSLAVHLKAMVLQCSNVHLKTRRAAIASLDTIFSVFPVLLCDATLLRGVLESLTLLRDGCESELDDEYSAMFEYRSERADITLVLPDDYEVRNEMLSTFYRHSKVWLSSALAASPAEMIGLLQEYLDDEATFELRADSGMGKGVALEIARQMPVSAREAGFPAYGGWRADTSSVFSSAFGTRHTYGSEANTLIGSAQADGSVDTHHVRELKARMATISEGLRLRKSRYKNEELRPILYRAAAVILAKPELDYELLREIVFIPVHAINPPAMHLGVEVWAWLVDRRADVEQKLMVDLHLAWAWTVRRRRGLFSILLKAEDPINSKTEYSPTDIPAIAKASRTVRNILLPHRYLLDFLSSRFQAYRYRDRYLVLSAMRLVIRSCQRYKIWGKHPLCRELRMKVLAFGFSILNSTHLEASLERTFRQQLYAAALSWFEEAPTWSYGSDRLQLQEDIRAIQGLLEVVKEDRLYSSNHLTSRSMPFDHEIKLSQYKPDKQKALQQLLIVHLENEIQRLAVWTNPLDDAKRGRDPPTQVAKSLPEHIWTSSVQAAWAYSPRLAVLMADRFKTAAIQAEVRRLVQADPSRASQVPEALHLFLGSQVSSTARPHLKHLVHWAPVSPVSALRYFLPAFNKEPLVLQYAMRVLEQHPVDLVFFYVPQVVQALRTDPLRYMERFIFETSKISQLFCHQMIWNMKANCYKDDLAEEADPDKEHFERMIDLIVDSLSGEAKDFYDKEFGFFNEVTAISRTLKPFVKKSKPEKKAKIDEEMAKIKVEKGVYLPSHPEGQVIDIDRHSGRPLQSHAKTPFMATFQVSREYEEEYSEEAITRVGGEHTVNDGKDGGANEGFPSLQGGESGKPRMKSEKTKIAAIFKVGDDCRQDVLAMQVIAQFKNMFNVFGLDLQVQPYRVLATGPGTGIIDVVPDATSRDEMGRAKINDLTSFFLFQFGPAESVAFQKARSNFIQSMAAYSVLCYILQIKDRHNGNIMIDGTGRITHIDFGFLFDIDKSNGIKFEPNSFKLTHEMITLMGGKESQGYRQFRELTVKAFLSCRAYTEDVVATCALMMPTELPSFKGEGTMIRLRERFRPELTEREAARYMVGVIENACENSMSIVYDRFQYLQNKIPYAS